MIWDSININCDLQQDFKEQQDLLLIYPEQTEGEAIQRTQLQGNGAKL